MTKKQETGLQRRIRSALELSVGGFWFKVHGGPFQRSGIGDLLGCVCGLYINLEVKVKSDDDLSQIQIETGETITEEGGIWGCVTTPAEAVAFVEDALQEAGRLSEARRRLRPRGKNSGVIIRAGDRDALKLLDPSIYDEILITPSGCWEYQGHRNNQGYGRTRRKKKLWRTHRLSFTLAYGPIPNGLDVLHECDNPPCINPAHLFLGDDDDNARDRERKGRGYHQGRRKLTRDQEVEIALLRAEEVSLKVVAKQYDVSISTISRVSKTTIPVQEARPLSKKRG